MLSSVVAAAVAVGPGESEQKMGHPHQMNS